MVAATPFRWAILGTGYVAHKFVQGLRDAASPAVATVVASRHLSNAQRFAAQHRIPTVAPDFATAVERDVDAVYIATPPAHHADHARLAFDSGKPVLIEKPLAHTYASATQIIEWSRSAGVFCMEGMWTRFLPLIATLRARITSGAIGNPRAFAGNFSSPLLLQHSASIFDRNAGGGALLHRAIYPLSLAQYFLGPIDASYTALQYGDTGVDDGCVVTLRHASGAISTCSASLHLAADNSASVYGSTGTIRIHPPLYRPARASITRVRARPPSSGIQGRATMLGGFRDSQIASRLHQHIGFLLPLARRRPIRAHYRGNGYQYEADEVHRAIRDEQLESAHMPLDQSLAVIEVIDAALRPSTGQRR